METQKKSFKKMAYWASVSVVGIVLGVSLQFVKAWSEPAVAPPGGNVGAPINISAVAQNKIGSIGSSGSISAAGAVQGSQLCIGSDCRNAWPAAGAVIGTSVGSAPASHSCGGQTLSRGGISIYGNKIQINYNYASFDAACTSGLSCIEYYDGVSFSGCSCWAGSGICGG